MSSLKNKDRLKKRSRISNVSRGFCNWLKKLKPKCLGRNKHPDESDRSKYRQIKPQDEDCPSALCLMSTGFDQVHKFSRFESDHMKNCLIQYETGGENLSISKDEIRTSVVTNRVQETDDVFIKRKSQSSQKEMNDMLVEPFTLLSPLRENRVCLFEESDNVSESLETRFQQDERENEETELKLMSQLTKRKSVIERVECFEESFEEEFFKTDEETCLKKKTGDTNVNTNSYLESNHICSEQVKDISNLYTESAYENDCKCTEEDTDSYQYFVNVSRVSENGHDCVEQDTENNHTESSSGNRHECTKQDTESNYSDIESDIKSSFENAEEDTESSHSSINRMSFIVNGNKNLLSSNSCLNDDIEKMSFSSTVSKIKLCSLDCKSEGRSDSECQIFKRNDKKDIELTSNKTEFTGISKSLPKETIAQDLTDFRKKDLKSKKLSFYKDRKYQNNIKAVVFCVFLLSICYEFVTFLKKTTLGKTKQGRKKTKLKTLKCLLLNIQNDSDILKQKNYFLSFNQFSIRQTAFLYPVQQVEQTVSMDNELNRYSTFRHFHRDVDCIRLAKNGLYHPDSANDACLVRCFYCEFVDTWCKDAYVAEMHRFSFPNCHHLVGSIGNGNLATESSGSGQLRLSRSVIHDRRAPSNEHQLHISVGDTNRSHEMNLAQREFVPSGRNLSVVDSSVTATTNIPRIAERRNVVHPDMAQMKKRYESFRNNNLRQFAEAGFFYSRGHNGCHRLICFCCGKILEVNNSDSIFHPWIKHVEISPTCDFVPFMKEPEFVKVIRMIKEQGRGDFAEIKTGNDEVDSAQPPLDVPTITCTPTVNCSTERNPDPGNSNILRWAGVIFMDLMQWVVFHNTCPVDVMLQPLFYMLRDNPDLLDSCRKSPFHRTLCDVYDCFCKKKFEEGRCLWVRYLGLLPPKERNGLVDLYGTVDDRNAPLFRSSQESKVINTCSNSRCPDHLQDKSEYSVNLSLYGERYTNMQKVFDMWLRRAEPCERLLSIPDGTCTDNVEGRGSLPSFIRSSARACNGRIQKMRSFPLGYPNFLLCNINRLQIRHSRDIDTTIYLDKQRYHLGSVIFWKNNHFTAKCLSKGRWMMYDDGKSELEPYVDDPQECVKEYVVYFRDCKGENVGPITVTSVTSSQSGAETGVTQRPVHPCFSNEADRLKSFKPWPTSLTRQNKNKMVDAGLFYTGIEDKCMCYYCGTWVKDWKENEDPWMKHMRINGDCNHLQQNVGESYTEADIFGLSEATGDTVPPSSNVFDQAKPPEMHSGIETDGDSSSSKRSLEDTSNCSNKKNKRCPSTHITKSGMGKEAVSPSQQPRLKSTRIYQSRDVSTSTMSHRSPTNQMSVQKSEIRNMHGVNLDTPRYPTYADQSERISTYKGWPSHLYQRPRDLSFAGFFYVGKGDMVRCFNCGGGLIYWDPGDDPWVEHARWFPRCAYVREILGDTFIEWVQETCAAEAEEQKIKYGNPENSYSQIEERSLQEENTQLREQTICKICMDKKVSVVFLPCGHLTCCENCAPAVRTCPVCRKLVCGTVKTYLV